MVNLLYGQVWSYRLLVRCSLLSIGSSMLVTCWFVSDSRYTIVFFYIFWCADVVCGYLFGGAREIVCI